MTRGRRIEAGFGAFARKTQWLGQGKASATGRGNESMSKGNYSVFLSYVAFVALQRFAAFDSFW
jgi:hypothetical protein